LHPSRDAKEALERIMAEADLHLKLDRILARQDEQIDKTADLEASITALVGGLSALSDGLNVQTELLERVIEAISAETPDSGLRDVLASIQASLKQIAEDGTRMVTVINTLPRAMSDAAIDGVRLALGEAVDVKPR